ncbi:MAG: hypothetical protein ACR2H8_05495 [Candidatus Nanopelagicaceae bacterium]
MQIRPGAGPVSVAGFLIVVAAADGEGVAKFSLTPLLQTIFLPDLTQVNFNPPELLISPIFVHTDPVFGDAAYAKTL